MRKSLRLLLSDWKQGGIMRYYILLQGAVVLDIALLLYLSWYVYRSGETGMWLKSIAVLAIAACYVIPYRLLSKNRNFIRGRH